MRSNAIVVYPIGLRFRLYQTMKVREAIKLIESDGWYLVRTTGSHRQFHHPVKSGTVTVAGQPQVELHPKTLASILRQAGLK